MHPPNETLARFVEGTVSEDERAIVTAELASCAECRAVVGALARRAADAPPIPRTFAHDEPGDEGLAPLTAGATIAGRYRVIRQLGAGGMGVVYDVEHVLLARRFALKTLHRALAARRDAVRRFLGEARALAHLGHRGIVEVVDTGNDDAGSPFLVMPLLVGETLEALIERQGVLGIESVLEIARDIARALAFAHGRGVVHRDVKPANVFVLEAPIEGTRVKLLDFGIAKLLDPDVTRTGSGVMLGTPRYMAPEQWTRPREVDARVDVFAWGVTVHRMLTGELPYAWADLAVLGATIARPDARKKRPEAPIALTSLVERCIALEPSARPRDGDEIVHALDALRASRVSTRPRASEAPSGARSDDDATTITSDPTQRDVRGTMSSAPEHASIAWQQSAVLASAPDATITAIDLGALGTPDPEDALDWLRRQRVLVRDESAEQAHRFVDEALAELAYRTMSEEARRATHALAASLRGRGLALDAAPMRWAEVGHHLARAGRALD
ncbi:MAG: protein kinase, partial [Deltaproteobacteria bacterium]|nr:protein kinase [Deltaproteobacteria bacterium]